jgi:predicted ABC-type ATPase
MPALYIISGPNGSGKTTLIVYVYPDGTVKAKLLSQN